MPILNWTNRWEDLDKSILETQLLCSNWSTPSPIDESIALDVRLSMGVRICSTPEENWLNQRNL